MEVLVFFVMAVVVRVMAVLGCVDDGCGGAGGHGGGGGGGGGDCTKGDVNNGSHVVVVVTTEGLVWA